MTTIAKTKRYRELDSRHINLVNLYAIMSELRLHTNKAFDDQLAKAYLNLAINKYPRFFVPVLESMRKYFYISLYSFIGAYLNPHKGVVISRDNDKYSLAQYLYDGTRASRKKAAKAEFENMLNQHTKNLELLHGLRTSLAHYEASDVTNGRYIFGDTEAIDILNRLGLILYLLGFHSGNKPLEFSYQSEPAEEVMRVIDDLMPDKKRALEYREQYRLKRSQWISG